MVITKQIVQQNTKINTNNTNKTANTMVYRSKLKDDMKKKEVIDLSARNIKKQKKMDGIEFMEKEIGKIEHLKTRLEQIGQQKQDGKERQNYNR